MKAGHPRRWLRATAATGAALLAGAACVHGGPPLETDDPDTPGAGRWEVNAATQMEKRGAAWEWAPVLDVNYGIGARVQLKVKPRYAVLDEPGRRARSGVGNIQGGVKWRFLDEQPHRFAMSIYPQVDVNPPGGSVRRGIVEDGTDFILPLQIARTFGKTRLYGEVGHVWRENRADGWIYGLAFELPLDGALRWTGEIRGGSEGGFARNEVLFNVGLKARLADHVTLLASAGRTLVEAPGERSATFSYLGLQFTF